ncbi:MAG: single-stranded DNA-binding protein [Brevinema sp.]
MAWDINRVVLVGRLSNDVDLRYAPSGAAVAKFGLAVGGKPAKDGADSVSFFNVVVWNKPAEFCGQYLRKGDRIAIDGRLEQRTWTAQDGARRSVVEIVADRVESLGSPSGRDSQPREGGNSAPQRAATPRQAPPPPKKEDDYYDNTDFKDEPMDYDPFGDENDVPF